MFAHLKSTWRHLAKGTPGHRFRDHFNHRNEFTTGRVNLGKIVNVCLGIILILVGIIFLPAPGPGSVVLIVGLGLLGSEVEFVARFLDWSEVELRKIVRWCNSYWQQASLIAKLLVCLIPSTTLGIAGYTFFRWYFES